MRGTLNARALMRYFNNHRWRRVAGLIAVSSSLMLSCARQPEETTPPVPEKAEAPSSIAPPPPPPPGSFLAQLQPDINAELLALEMPIVIPTYLPPGFELAAYETGTQPEGPFYALIYRNANDQCFAIEAASGGVGGPVLETRLPLESPLFGSSYVLYTGQLTELEAPATAATPDLVSDWLAGDVALYRYIGARLTMTDHDQSACSDLAAEEAVKVIESLAYLTSDIYGDYGDVPSDPSDVPTEPVIAPPN